MNGQLSEIPLIELIREISAKKISGKLQLQRDKLKVVVYFQSGEVTFSACNLPSLRLGSYFVKQNLISDDDLRYLGRKTGDFDLARTLVSEKKVSQEQVKQLQSKQVRDILLVALLWTDGTWAFDNRAHLNEEIEFKIDVTSLLLETLRSLPATFISSRYRNLTELFSPVADPPNVGNLSSVEIFVFSRIENPTTLSDLVTISGLPEEDVQRAVYSLAVAGLIKRQNWKHGFRDVVVEPEVEPVAPPVVEPEPEVKKLPDDLETFLHRLVGATNHYEVLNAPPNASAADLKNAYYDLARSYHPDLFRSASASLLARIESAFARITQAYDTLRDPGLRASYDSKLDSQARAAKLAQSAPKGVSEDSFAGPRDEQTNEATLTPQQRAEMQFKEGFAALELGQRNVALGLLGSAARTFKDEPRYRAYFGRCLAMHESTRRLAEAELQAALRLDPNNPEYRMMLAELYRDLGFIVRARSEAERAVAADQNNRKARELLKSLR